MGQEADTWQYADLCTGGSSGNSRCDRASGKGAESGRTAGRAGRSASAGDAAVQAGRRGRIFYGRRCGGGYQPENDTPSSACVWRDSHRIGRTALEGMGADQGLGETTDDVSGGSSPQKTEEKTGADT